MLKKQQICYRVKLSVDTKKVSLQSGIKLSQIILSSEKLLLNLIKLN